MSFTRLLPALAIVAAIAGCGAGGAVSTAATESGISRSAAEIYGAATNLRQEDVAGFTAYGGARELRPSAGMAEFASCSGGVNPQRAVLWLISPVYADERETFSSAVLVMPSTEQASILATAGLSRRGFGCQAREEAGEASLRRYGNPVLSRLPDPLPGVPGSYELRTVRTRRLSTGPNGSTAPATVHRYEDELGFQAGPALIDLVTVSYAHPVPLATELRVLDAIYHRAESRRL